MSLLSYLELVDLVERGVITNVDPANINGSSIDVTLGNTIYVEVNDRTDIGIVDPLRKDNYHLKMVEIGERGFVLQPNEFILAHTEQMFYLPDNISAEFKLKSSGARSGLDHALASWCDPCWTGSVLTLEFKNNLNRHGILLRAGMKIGQMIFHKHAVAVPADKSYAVRGQYNNNSSVQVSMGVK